MAYPASYYSRDPAENIGLCTKLELKAQKKAARKARRAMYGCQACQRYHYSLETCSEGQEPNIGFTNTAIWCRWWWSDDSPYPAPEISR